MKRVMTECPHCRGSIQVTVDGNKLRLQAINVEPVTDDEIAASQRMAEGWALADRAFGTMNEAFNRMFGRRS